MSITNPAVEESGEVVRIEQTGAVLELRLNRPGKFNCFNLQTIERMDDAVRDAEQGSSVRVVLLSAEGRHFSTGADLAEIESIRHQPASMRHLLERGLALQRRLEASPLPVVAAVNGLCLAGGLEMMLACDVVFCGRSARFGDQHARFGLIPGWGGSQRLPQAIGMRRSLDLMFTGKWIDSATAQAWGLVNHVVEDADLRTEALDYCKVLSHHHPAGLAAMKRLARDSASVPLDEGLRRETDLAVAHIASAAVTEGLAAFRQGRAPDFG